MFIPPQFKIHRNSPAVAYVLQIPGKIKNTSNRHFQNINEEKNT